MSAVQRRAWVAVIGLLLCGPSLAEYMLMSRVPLRAEIVLEYVTGSVQEHGYHVAHLQKCDGGMKGAGYFSDFYQVVFFGKVEEVRALSEKHPELVSYLPLKLAVIAEKGETLLTVLDPYSLTPFVDDPLVRVQLERWHSDLVSILEDVRLAIEKRTKAH